MAKSLPYFKFFCSEWSDGDITLEDYQTQGLFINICAYYWSNECVVELSKLKKKFRGYESLIDEIIDSNLIKLQDGFISISFLNEQQIEREQQFIVKSKGGLASAEARKLAKLKQEGNIISTETQHVLNSCSTETQLLREDKIREDNNKSTIATYSIEKAIEICLRDLEWITATSENCNLDKDKFQYALNDFKKNCISIGRNEDRTLFEFKSHFVNWVKIKKTLKAKETVKDRL